MELRWRHFIDASKGLTPAVVLAVMHHYGKLASPTAWTYFATHGSYGVLWVLKSQIFPDAAWERPISITKEQVEAEKKKRMWTPIDMLLTMLGPASGLVIFLSLAGYWTNIYLVCNKEEAHPALLGALGFAYAVGVFLHFGSDMQKHMHMASKKGLVTDMFFARTRNPNYLGELIIYGTFAALTRDFRPALFLLTNVLAMWYPNMLKKDKSISRHPGWDEYVAKTWMLFPKLL